MTARRGCEYACEEELYWMANAPRVEADRYSGFFIGSPRGSSAQETRALEIWKMVGIYDLQPPKLLD